MPTFDLASVIQTFSVYAFPVLLAITLHEAAHGYAARHFGDHTAEQAGRITLNPLAHIDLVGTILIPIGLYVLTAGSFLFGYAKPVPVNFSALRRPKRDMIWVALAGPGSNVFQALGWAVLLVLLYGLGSQEAFLQEVAKAGIRVNVIMTIFNLLPLPPVDGGRILVGLLPWRAAVAVSRIEPYGFFILLALLFTGLLSDYWMRPLMGLSFELINELMGGLLTLFFRPLAP
jgi:Zn-dependent protease